MKVLFLTLARIIDISTRGIYEDLMRKFQDEGHELIIATPSERRYKEKTSLIQNNNIFILKIKILNIQKTNIIEKGLSTILIEYHFLRAIKKYFKGVCFDLVLYSTPPITFTRLIRYFKLKDGAKSYLLLKDIFPQNAIDLGMIKRNGFLHKYFRKKEKDLYAISDHIGCMSQANVDYVCRNNPQINSEIIEVNPNSIEPSEFFMSKEDKQIIRRKYQIPSNSTVFIYGGNLGKPQGIDFLIEVLDSHLISQEAFFVIVGSGTEYSRLKTWFDIKRPARASLIPYLPRKEFDNLLQSCDIGMIFLDKRFTIPNFPSRLLSYLDFKLPVIAATDKITDIGRVIMENEFGLWSESGDLQAILSNIIYFINNSTEIPRMGEKGHEFMKNNYSVDVSYSTIMNHFIIR